MNLASILYFVVALGTIGIGIYTATHASTIASLGSPDSKTPPSEAKTRTITFVSFILVGIAVLAISIPFISAGAKLFSIENTTLFKSLDSLGTSLVDAFVEAITNTVSVPAE